MTCMMTPEQQAEERERVRRWLAEQEEASRERAKARRAWNKRVREWLTAEWLHLEDTWRREEAERRLTELMERPILKRLFTRFEYEQARDEAQEAAKVARVTEWMRGLAPAPPPVAPWDEEAVAGRPEFETAAVAEEDDAATIARRFAEDPNLLKQVVELIRKQGVAQEDITDDMVTWAYRQVIANKPLRERIIEAQPERMEAEG